MAAVVGIPGYAKSPGESAYPQLWKGLVSAWSASIAPAANDLIGVNHGTVSCQVRNPHWRFDDAAGTHNISMGDVLDQDGTSPLSVSCWVRWRSGFGGTTGRNFVSKQRDSSPWTGWSLDQATAGTGDIRLELINTVTSSDLRVRSTSAVLTAERWHHICATYDGSQAATGVKLYCDGIEITSKTTEADTLSGSLANAIPLQIGNRNTSSTREMDGDITDVLIHNRVLKHDEVALLAKLPFGAWAKRRPLYFPTESPAAATTTTAAIKVDIPGYAKSPGERVAPLARYTGGLFRDQSHQGSRHPTATNGTTVKASSIGEAYELNGSSNYIDINKAFGVSDYPITMSAWVKTDHDSATQCIMSFTDRSTSDVYWAIELRGGVASIVTRNTFFGNTAGTTAVTSASGWTHICGVFDNRGGPKVRRIYVNGILDNSATHTTTQPSSAVDTLLIGMVRVTSPTDYFDGQITDCRFYKRALNDAEVREIYLQRGQFKRRPLYFPTEAAAAVGGNALPMAMNLYRRLRS